MKLVSEASTEELQAELERRKQRERSPKFEIKVGIPYVRRLDVFYYSRALLDLADVCLAPPAFYCLRDDDGDCYFFTCRPIYWHKMGTSWADMGDGNHSYWFVASEKTNIAFPHYTLPAPGESGIAWVRPEDLAKWVEMEKGE